MCRHHVCVVGSEDQSRGHRRTSESALVQREKYVRVISNEIECKLLEEKGQERTKPVKGELQGMVKTVMRSQLCKH